MVSNSQNPYKVIEENPLDYSFVSRDGINYHLYFTPISSIYPDLVNTYSFSIEREGTNPHPIDPVFPDLQFGRREYEHLQCWNEIKPT